MSQRLAITEDVISFDFSVPAPPPTQRPDGPLPEGRWDAEVIELGSKTKKVPERDGTYATYATMKLEVFRGEYTEAQNPAYVGTAIYVNDFDGTLMEQLIRASGYLDDPTGKTKTKGTLTKEQLLNFIVVVDVVHKLKDRRDPAAGVWVNAVAIYAPDNVPPLPERLPALGADEDLPF